MPVQRSPRGGSPRGGLVDRGAQPGGAPSSSWLTLTAALLAFLCVYGFRLLLQGGARDGSALHSGGCKDGACIGSRNDLAAVAELLAAWPEGKPKACIVILARNSDVEGVLSSVHQLERRFNVQAGRQYPYCYLNDKPFSEEFKRAASAATSSPCFFDTVPPEHWSFPAHINQTRAAEERAAARGRVPYGGSESYRFMCRYFSGLFFEHPLLAGFDWYWRVEPGVHFMCDVPADPFKVMAASNQSMAWVIVMQEVMGTIPTLWPAVQAWLAANPQHVAQHPLLPAFLQAPPGAPASPQRSGGDGGSLRSGSLRSSGGIGSSGSSGNRAALLDWFQASQYRGGHFWSNFEIGRLAFFRSAAYRSYFAHLEAAGGFFYERWGDAPVHTLAAAAMLDRHQVWFAEPIGYHHGSWSYCPLKPEYRQRCDCSPSWDYHVGAEPSAQADFTQRLAQLEGWDPL